MGFVSTKRTIFRVKNVRDQKSNNNSHLNGFVDFAESFLGHENAFVEVGYLSGQRHFDQTFLHH